MGINVLEHLFLKGEYPERGKLLSGLTLDQVTAVPEGISHSIFEELWHLTTCQDTVASNDESKDKSLEDSNGFPVSSPADINEWNDLVKKFNDGVKKILEYSAVPENHQQEIEPGYTLNDTLSCLAVHNAVHFGKILAIRQAIGAWPPEEKK
ncbi:MAG: hypothetical protein M3P82_01285 [Bacteroidota bacterium]|nr:hypothetical protein [Bacteroidota bacterium]